MQVLPPAAADLGFRLDHDDTSIHMQPAALSRISGFKAKVAACAHAMTMLDNGHMPSVPFLQHESFACSASRRSC